jgi:type VI secretion system secreted protein VgrG
VFIEGKAIVRNTDIFTSNKMNTPPAPVMQAQVGPGVGSSSEYELQGFSQQLKIELAEQDDGEALDFILGHQLIVIANTADGKNVQRQIHQVEGNILPTRIYTAEEQELHTHLIYSQYYDSMKDESIVTPMEILELPENVNWAESPFGMELGKVESRNDYSAYNRTLGGLKSFFNTKLTSMTIKQVLLKQKTRDIFAVGRFQLIPSTLNAAIRSLKINTSSLFDKEVQDIIFNDYLIKKKRSQIIKFLEGSGNIEDAMHAWAKEFASAGVEKGKKISRGRIAKGGESYYSGDGLNKAHLTPEKMKSVLLESKSLYQG